MLKMIRGGVVENAIFERAADVEGRAGKSCTCLCAVFVV
jgi:hypothetical protein